MTDLDNLLGILKNSGIEIPKHVEDAMYKVNIEDFTDFDTSGFYFDRPVVFLKSTTGGIKNISAPHMIVTLLHNLELEPGQQIVVYGAKGGYISALIAHIVGENGRVLILDPSTDVIRHVANKLRGYPTIEQHQISDINEISLPELNRVLVTGQLEKLPVWLSEGLADGGFTIAPLGDRATQRLLKIEKQGSEVFETDLGSVVFGPLDIAESVGETPSPNEMAEMIEQVIELMSYSGIIEENDKSKLYDLVADLRQLPDDLPPPDEMENPDEHPMLKLMIQKGEWFIHLWPIIQAAVETSISSYDFDKEFEGKSGHSDFIP